jgi:hypothetical protein
VSLLDLQESKDETVEEFLEEFTEKRMRQIKKIKSKYAQLQVEVTTKLNDH